MELDASIILPALFFTILAVVLAAKFIPKKQPEEKKKRVKVGNRDDIPPARALTPAVGVVEVPKVEIPPPVIVPKVKVPPQVVDAEVLTEPVTVAPVVEEINVVEEETVKEPEIIPEVQPVPEPVVEPEPVPEPITEPEPIPVIVEEPILELIAEPEPVSVVKEVPVRELTPEPAREPKPKPVREPTPEPIFVPEPEDLESNAEEVHFTPGMKISKLEKLMTKEEMEEEQRVQNDQLAAIFLLLMQNQEALGEVTEGDMEEQLKLYSL
ncbi:matrix-remodeling-associated protein 7 isoform X2 [Salvelinus sp. IW2-2015]|uniref:matrix-remodeling-associated protein 7 isoform X2 n=1 Tax=Salvelinus sp. IW2-2015 TaxID=2691554 RepID=UPI000CDF91B7|nr:matrix-remodeling-associated protein 7-like isoform X2 [Salvelinus alpinus]